MSRRTWGLWRSRGARAGVGAWSVVVSVMTAVAMIVSPVAIRPVAAADTKPVKVVAPTLSGTYAVGSTVTVTPGTWTGVAPITFSYLFQTCSTSGSSCTNAPGLFAKGMRPRLLLVAATAGKTLRVKVTATNPLGAASVTTALSAPIAAYPSNAPPLVELVNGVPDAQSWSPTRRSSSRRPAAA